MMLTNRSVLCIDSNAISLWMIKTMLVQYNATVMTATTGDDALDILNDWQPDCIILDMHLVGMSGYALIRHVTDLYHPKKLPPVVIQQAYAGTTSSLAVPIAGTLKKPVDSNALKACLTPLFSE